MADFRVTITLRSALGTPLQADTLFGHLCWAWRLRRGEAWLGRLLAAYGEDHAPLVLSDGFPTGWLPMPTLPLASGAGDSAGALEARKRLRASRYVRADWLLAAARGGLALAFAELVAEATRDPRRLDDLVRTEAPGRHRDGLHASIDRRTNRVRQPAGLYAQRDYLPGRAAGVSPTRGLPDERWTVWVRSDDGAVPDIAEALREGLADLERHGYGRDASSGLGRIDCDVDEDPLPQVEGADGFLGLSGFVPRPEDPAQGWWSLRAKFGKLGGWWATGPGPDGHHDPFKRPIVMLDAGSVFRDKHPRRWYGQLLSGVHRDPRVRHYALCLPLEVKVDA